MIQLACSDGGVMVIRRQRIRATASPPPPPLPLLRVLLVMVMACAFLISRAAGANLGHDKGKSAVGSSLGEWRTARATRYDGPDDWWSIHEGSCGYGYLEKSVATGWDIVALSDACEDFSGSCGRCMEVKCDPMTFTDGYGQKLDREHVCRDPEASVIVQCCGDMYHVDLSVWAFEKLAENKWGVIGLQVRQVPCWHEPQKRAYSPPDATPLVSRLWKPSEHWRDRRYDKR
ncbi:atexp4,atexpa4,athexp alpha 1.6,expa4 [Pleodorina starrii]|uniref:Atexp4,atexpa4,athexp alpha 1.6,expa4 n=1 Tax=Pleodorina starrii TaxID=330485 RepID=A0A9W6BLM2_9CHLO|nr:atexp4,atexpa4,athexp alpha 1.6,expa4 [Pleodorina starrii]